MGVISVRLETWTASSKRSSRWRTASLNDPSRNAQRKEASWAWPLVPSAANSCDRPSVGFASCLSLLPSRPVLVPQQRSLLLPVNNTFVYGGASSQAQQWRRAALSVLTHACVHTCVRATPVRGTSHAPFMPLISFHPQMIEF